MNVPFRIGKNDEQLEKEFLSGASARGMLQLKGHRSVQVENKPCIYNIYTLKIIRTMFYTHTHCCFIIF